MSFSDSIIDNCGIVRAWTAIDSAGNSAGASQVIVFSDPLPPVVISPSWLQVACGNIEDTSRNLNHNMLLVQHPCNRTVMYHYTDSANLTQCNFTFTRSWEVDDDCGQSIQFSQTIRVLEQQFPDSPADGALNVALQTPLLWPQYPGATVYEVYVWIQGDERPSRPVTVTSGRVYYPSRPYRPGTMFLWQIEYMLSGNTTIPSPVWQFQTMPQPDMEIIDVNVPQFAYSGQSFNVSWTVINSGNLSITNFFFYDAIYLSRTAAELSGRRVGQVIQRRFLDPHDGYNSQAQINLNDNDVGTFYVFVVADSSNSVSSYIHNATLF